MSVWTIYFDGLCGERNPGGRMAWGFTIDREGRERENGKGTQAAHPSNTNNRAEYFALGCALKRALELKATDGGCDGLLIYGDSKLVVEQINERWNVNAEGIRPLHRRCLELLKQFEQPWTCGWIARENNEDADLLSREAWASAEGRMPRERQKKTA